jgi:Zn-dependent peptidase ImmA (M78 family)
MAKAPQVPRRTFKDISRVAEEFLAAHHPTGGLPIPIEELIEFDCELDIVPIPGLMSDLDIDAFITADLKEIRVDQYIQQRVPTRYRASLAHELSHYLIHREFFEQLKFETIAEWKQILASLDEAEIGRLESQARLLGALILVPPQQLEEQFDIAHEKLPSSLSLDRLTDRAKEIFAGGVAKPFEVSAALMLRRLGQDRLL